MSLTMRGVILSSSTRPFFYVANEDTKWLLVQQYQVLSSFLEVKVSNPVINIGGIKEYIRFIVQKRANGDVEHFFFECKFSLIVWKWLHSQSSILSSTPMSLSDPSLKTCCYDLSKKFKRMKSGLIYSFVWMICWNTFSFKKMRCFPMKT